MKFEQYGQIMVFLPKEWQKFLLNFNHAEMREHLTSCPIPENLSMFSLACVVLFSTRQNDLAFRRRSFPAVVNLAFIGDDSWFEIFVRREFSEGRDSKAGLRVCRHELVSLNEITVVNLWMVVVVVVHAHANIEWMCHIPKFGRPATLPFSLSNTCTHTHTHSLTFSPNLTYMCGCTHA